MSRHRDTVFALAESIADATRRVLDDDLTRQLLESGTAPRVELFGAVPDNETLALLKREAEGLVQSAGIEDFRCATIAIELHARDRISRCVAGSAVTSRRFNIADVRVTVEVQTRWVHPRREVEFSRQWAIA